MKAIRTTVIGALLAMMVVLSISGCEGDSKQAADRKWLADRTDQFLNLYKVAYGSVAGLQTSPHPCTKGSKAEAAAGFHATLSQLHSTFTLYRDDVEKRVGWDTIQDPACRDLLSVIVRLSRPFSDSGTVQKCGSLDAASAKEQFYLQTPLEAYGAVKELRQKMTAE